MSLQLLPLLRAPPLPLPHLQAPPPPALLPRAPLLLQHPLPVPAAQVLIAISIFAVTDFAD